MPNRTETCRRCGKQRGPEDTTHTHYCRECWKAKQREYRQKSPRRPSETCSRCKGPRGDSSHLNYCRDCMRIRQREYRKQHPPQPSAVCSRCGKQRGPEDGKHLSYCLACWRAYHRARQYGITAEQFDAMLEAQGGVCAICQSNGLNGRTGRTLHVDHDHGTGRNRDLLCDNCNLGIGNFRDDPALLRTAADYLEMHAEAAAFLAPNDPTRP